MKRNNLLFPLMLSGILFCYNSYIYGQVVAGDKSNKTPDAVDRNFFNQQDLTGWSSSEMSYWSVRDGAIVGHSSEPVKGNKFLWSNVAVGDFYFVLDVRLEPDSRNAGIQIRSKKVDENGQAYGYQADVGVGYWGKLYHEHGRAMLDSNDHGLNAVEPGKWNRYEILAVGHQIWTSINGTLCTAIEDPLGELTGYIAFQIHGGEPQTVSYRIIKLEHNPKIELEGYDESQLKKKLKAPLN